VRRLSFFTMVLCHSRMLYAEFFFGESLEFWMAAHRNAFEYFGGVTERVVVDNCKTAVIVPGRNGQAPRFNEHYSALAQHYGFTIDACTPGRPNEKGRVEKAVAFVKSSFLAGREPSAPEALNPALWQWLQTTANVRKHRTTLKRPCDVFAELEKPQLKPLEIKKEDFLRHITSDEKVLISHKEKDLTDEPAYLDYYNAVRSKIYKAANANKPYYFMEGQVSLLFILARDGRLLNATVLDDGSTANPILRRHALSGINRASPFPPFHESIKEDHLTLRLTISFEK